MRKTLIGMAVVFLGLTLGLPIKAMAASVETIPSDLSFNIIEGDQQPSANALDRLANSLKTYDLESLPTDGKGPSLLHFMDRIYTDAKLGKTIFLKFNFQMDQEQYVGKLLADGKRGYFYQGRTSSGIPYMAYFLSFEERTAKKVIAAVQKSLGTSAAVESTEPKTQDKETGFRLRDLLIASAYAEDASGDCWERTPEMMRADNARLAKEFAEKTPVRKVLSLAWNCLKGAARGVGVATGGVLVQGGNVTARAGQAVENAFNQPVRRTVKNAVKKTVHVALKPVKAVGRTLAGVGHFIEMISSDWKSLEIMWNAHVQSVTAYFDGLDSLSPQERAQLYCEWVVEATAAVGAAVGTVLATVANPASAVVGVGYVALLKMAAKDSFHRRYPGLFKKKQISCSAVSGDKDKIPAVPLPIETPSVPSVPEVPSVPADDGAIKGDVKQTDSTSGGE